MLLATINIQAAGLQRAASIVEWLNKRDDHIFVLTETSNGAGTAHLLTQCREAGWSVLTNAGAAGDRGCAVVSRLPLTPLPELTSLVSLPGRAIACSVASEPELTVFGIYVPSSDRSPDKVGKKREFLDSVSSTLKGFTPARRRGLVLCGDYNVITRDHEPPYRGTFLPWEYAFLDSLTGEFGLVDAFRHLHPTQPHSWFGRSGNAYCFDYIHVSSGLAPFLASCTYDHQPRIGGLTDHAAVTAALNVKIDHMPIVVRSPASAGMLF